MAARRWLEQVKPPDLDRLEMDQLLARWKLLEEQQKQLDQRIRERSAAHEQVAVLKTTPGAKGYTALALALAARALSGTATRPNSGEFSYDRSRQPPANIITK